MKTLRPWLRLVRLPNLVTVPGDPLAGFLLASAGTLERPHMLPLFAAMGTALFLYLFGLILNDIVDLETDKIERPDRPLPAGEISLPQARMAAIAVALSGLNLALIAGKPALFVTAFLASAILLYNGKLKNVPVLGALAMGSCRGLSLLLGVAAARPEWLSHLLDAPLLPSALAVLVVTFYVASFTALARHETEQDKPMGVLRWSPFGVLLIGLPCILILVTALKQTAGMAPTLFVFLFCMSVMRAWLLGGPLYRVQEMPLIIGGFIRNLLLIQAALCVACGTAGILPAITLVLLFAIFPRLAKAYYSS
jgi:4-hydroxybenzoate polyprenyltransferase